MPLSFAHSNDLLTIKKITGKDKVKNHLMNLGFVEGKDILVISTLGENLIVKVGEIRIALSKSLANRVMV